MCSFDLWALISHSFLLVPYIWNHSAFFITLRILIRTFVKQDGFKVEARQDIKFSQFRKEMMFLLLRLNFDEYRCLVYQTGHFTITLSHTGTRFNTLSQW